MATRDEIAVESCDSERTISDGFVGNQEEDDALEAESVMVLPPVAEKEARSDSGTTLQGGSFAQIAGHGYSDGLDVDSASRAKTAVVKSKSSQVAEPKGYIPIPLDDWMMKIDSGEGIWRATIKYRSDGKHDKYYFHKEYDYSFRSKPEVAKFLETGIVPGRGVIKKRSADTTTYDHDHRRTTKRRRIGAAKLSNPTSTSAGSSGSTRGRIAPTRTKLPHGFV